MTISFFPTDVAVKEIMAGTPLFSRIFPESPRWLIAHDRLNEAQSIIERYGGKDGKPVDSEVLRVLLENVRRDQLEREREAKKHTPIDLFRTPKLRKWAVIFCYQWYKSQYFFDYFYHSCINSFFSLSACCSVTCFIILPFNLIRIRFY